MLVHLLMFAAGFGMADGAFLTANEIMAHVAANQDRAVEMRRDFIYQQRVVVATRYFNGKVAREEKSDYEISPSASGQDRKMSQISGRYTKKKISLEFAGEPVPEKDSLDGGLVRGFRDDLLNEKNKDGVSKDLFPLTTEEQKQYRFQMLGRRLVQGRDTYVIGFSPVDAEDISWAGEAWIDIEELQPVRVFTKLSKRIPFFVRTMLGTDLPGLGFNVQYKRLEKDVWFPESFGSEFRLRAVFFIKRDISVSMQASGFRRAQVRSTVDFAAIP